LKNLEKGILLEKLEETYKEKIEKKICEAEFRILRRITETQFHTEDLYDCENDEYKHNRYSDVLPCILNYLLIFKINNHV